MNYLFHTTCQDAYSVGSYGEDINEMTQSHHMVEIDNKAFISKIAVQSGIQSDLLERFRVSRKAFSDDWGISCHRSHFQGLECLYVRHSGIEHIFVREDLFSLIVAGEEAERRRQVISELEDLLDEDTVWQEAQGLKEEYQALANFLSRHKEAFQSNHILMASLFAYQNPYEKLVKAIDKNLLLCHDMNLVSKTLEPDILR